MVETSFELSEKDWISAEAQIEIVAKVKMTQLPMFIFMLLMIFLLYGHTSTTTLLLWSFSSVLLSGLRYHFLESFTKEVKNRSSHFRDYVLVAYGSGFLWGSSLILYNQKSSVNVGIFCLLVVACVGIFSVYNLSSNLRHCKIFLVFYSGGMVLANLIQISQENISEVSTTKVWLFGMIAVFAYLLFMISKNANSTFMDKLRFEYQNAKLISSLRVENERALAAIAVRDRMFASAAHDIRQPVITLGLYLDMARRDASMVPEVLPKISDATKSVIALFDSMFDLAKLNQGQIAVSHEWLNIRTLFDSLFIQYEPQAIRRNITLKVEYEEVMVFTDKVLVLRLLGNLVANAIKYTNKGGVTIRARRSFSGALKVSIVDTGIGISKDQKKKVFLEFYRGTNHSGTTDGFGLGLSLVTQLAQLLNLKFQLSSREGIGTIATITFTQAKPSSSP